MNALRKNSLSKNSEWLHTSAMSLSLVTLVCATLVALTWWLTHETIQESEQLLLESRLQQIIPAGSYNNNLLQDVTQLTHDNTGLTVYRARIDGKPAGLIFDTITGKGYSGDIRLLVGISPAGDVTAVRVISHKETPGLGDDIEISRSDWINSFNGRSLTIFSKQQWQVKKDGGEFDQFTGATITPRAVVNAVYHMLRIHQKRRDELYERPSIDTAPTHG